MRVEARDFIHRRHGQAQDLRQRVQMRGGKLPVSVLDDVQIFDKPISHQLLARKQSLNLAKAYGVELAAPVEFSRSTFSRLPFRARTVRHKLVLAADILYQYFAPWRIKSMRKRRRNPLQTASSH